MLCHTQNMERRRILFISANNIFRRWRQYGPRKLCMYLTASHPRRLYECLCLLSREEAVVDYFEAVVHKFRAPVRRRD